MSNAIAGPGFFLQKGDGGSPEAFTTVAEVHDINGPALSTDTHDVTNQSSAGGYEEIIPGIRRSGETTFDVNYVPNGATHDASTGVQADLNAKTLRNWKLTLNNTAANYYTFSGYVTKFEVKAPVNGVLTASVTIKITGQPVLH